jgi:hypothetical protein
MNRMRVPAVVAGTVAAGTVALVALTAFTVVARRQHDLPPRPGRPAAPGLVSRLDTS